MPVLHTIKAYLYDNTFTSQDTHDYIARTVSDRSLGIKEVCEAAVSRGNAEMGAAAMQYTVELFLKEMAYQLCDGYSINTGYFTASAQIRGVFTSPDDRYDPARHSLYFQLTQGEKLRKEIPRIDVSILGIADSAPVIHQVKDVKSGSINGTITPGKTIVLKGSKIKLAGEHPDVGLYLISAQTGERMKISEDEIALNNPSEIIAMLPALEPGPYFLEILTQYRPNSILLKQPKLATFGTALMVP